MDYYGLVWITMFRLWVPSGKRLQLANWKIIVFLSSVNLLEIGLNLTFMTFHSVGNVIFPTDEVIFFRRVGIPPTSEHEMWVNYIDLTVLPNPRIMVHKGGPYFRLVN